MNRRVLVAFAFAFLVALVALWFVHRRSVERSLALVRTEQLKETLSESRLVARDGLRACAANDVDCEARLKRHVERVEKDLLALEELDILHDELAVSVALYGVAPFFLVVVVAYAALLMWTRRLFRPLRALTDAALVHAKTGTAAFIVPESGPEDVRALAVALRRMTETIQRQSESLTAHARSLGWREIAREVVHESKNLLTPLKLGAEALFERAHDRDDDKLAEECKRLLTGLSALERMTSSLRDLSTHRLPTMDPVSMSLVFQRVASVHESRGISITHDASAASEAIGDDDLLCEALGNMMVNAAEAGAQNVALTARNDGMNVVIECVDDGRGIAKDVLGRATMLGYSTKTGGTGFGLYFADKLASELGGRLELDSSASGTRVRIVLRRANVS